jgi:hypothetical protein
LNFKGCLVEGCVACTLGSLSCGFIPIDDDSQIRLGVNSMDGDTYTWSRYTLIYNVYFVFIHNFIYTFGIKCFK